MTSRKPYKGCPIRATAEHVQSACESLSPFSEFHNLTGTFPIEYAFKAANIPTQTLQLQTVTSYTELRRVTECIHLHSLDLSTIDMERIHELYNAKQNTTKAGRPFTVSISEL